jgi:tryptophan-rich sensory protein
MFIPIQKLQDQTFTFISVLLTFITALIVLIISYQYSLSIFLLFIPYCLWLGFATLLQYNIKLLNP